MQSIELIINRLKTDYPQFKFEPSTICSWSYDNQTICYSKTDNNFYPIFHELGHALLNHKDYKRDIELISMEQAAWKQAERIAKKYNLKIDEDYIQYNLDTYRNWLHKRSSCPKCTANGIQVSKNSYRCLACNNEWRVNEARICELRRYNK